MGFLVSLNNIINSANLSKGGEIGKWEKNRMKEKLERKEEIKILKLDNKCGWKYGKLKSFHSLSVEM